MWDQGYRDDKMEPGEHMWSAISDVSGLASADVSFIVAQHYNALKGL